MDTNAQLQHELDKYKEKEIATSLKAERAPTSETSQSNSHAGNAPKSANPATLIEPPLKARKNANGSRREFFDHTPAYFFQQFDGKNPDQRMQLAKTYIGNWISLTGVVESASNSGAVTFVDVDGWDANSYRQQMLLFRAPSNNRVAFVRTGERLKAVCQLAGLGIDGRFDLDNCEIVD